MALILFLFSFFGFSFFFQCLGRGLFHVFLYAFAFHFFLLVGWICYINAAEFPFSALLTILYKVENLK